MPLRLGGAPGLGVPPHVAGPRTTTARWEDGYSMPSMDLGPIIGAAIKAQADTPEQKAVVRLWERVLTPSADALGVALGRWTEQRVANLGRVVEKADKKAGGRNGIVSPRVTRDVIEEGSLSDDEVMAEYYSGILAGSRSEDGSDDRAVPWTKLIGGLSTYQLRMHFLLYREWAKRLTDHPELELNIHSGRVMATLRVNLREALRLVGWKQGMSTESLTMHCLSGLIRAGLLGETFRYGPSEEDGLVVPWPSYLEVNMAIAGMELYAWALGRPELPIRRFPELASIELDDEPLPALSGSNLARLDPAQPGDGSSGPELPDAGRGGTR